MPRRPYPPQATRNHTSTVSRSNYDLHSVQKERGCHLPEDRCALWFLPAKAEAGQEGLGKEVKQFTLKLTGPELGHIFDLLNMNSQDGIYFGNVKQYWARHDRIVEKINQAYSDSLPDKK